MKKIKKFFIDLINRLKEVPKKYLIIISAILLISIISILIIFNMNRLTKLEEIKIQEFSNKIENYIEEFMNTKDEGKYLNFAIEYLYNTTDKTEFKEEEVREIVNTTFNVNYQKEDILNIGISPKMLDKGITYDAASDIFTYKAEKTRVDIANSQIVKYELTDIKKAGKDKFFITYKKYVIANPYEILNYYNNLNIEENKNYDTSIISEYLKGNKKVSELKEYLDENEITKFGKYDSELKLELVIKNNILVINKS